MTGKATRIVSLLLFSVAACTSLACGDDESEAADQSFRGLGHSPRPGSPSPHASAAAKAQAHGTGLIEKETKPGEGEGGLSLPKLSETDFIPGLKHRDPFKPFIEVIARADEVQQTVQREIKLKEYDISELKLIGIITNIGDPRAMVVTKDGTGFVLRRGDYVGRADFVDTGGGGEKIQVNWRVARIHGSSSEEERGVYLVRDDPTTTTGADVTRFMPLHKSE